MANEYLDELKLEVWHDEDPMDPRKAFCTPSVMVCFHRRLNLGDVHKYQSGDFTGWEALKKRLHKDHDIQVILPVYMMDHSGYALSTAPFGCPWDSGQIGWIFCTNEHTLALGLEDDEAVAKFLTQELAQYDDYLNGRVYGYSLYQKRQSGDWELLTSCGGYYGVSALHDEMRDLKREYPDIKIIAYKDGIPALEDD